MVDALFGIVVVAGCVAFVALGWSLPWYMLVLLVVVEDVALVVAQADNAPRNVSMGSLMLLRFVVMRRLSL